MSDGGESQGSKGGIAQARTQSSAFPKNYRPIVFEGFETLNMKPPRAAIADGEMAWCDGWMPIAPSVLRTLPDAGDAIFTAPGILAIKWFGFGNIDDTNYGYALMSDGSLIAFNTDTGSTVEVMPAGTVSNPREVLGFSQWGTLYALFASDQTNGYWLWDGTSLFTAGAVDPEVELTAAGEDYTSAPTVTTQTTGSGTGEVLTATIDNGSVTKITVTSPGSGYTVDDFITVLIQGGGSDDQALAFAPTVHTDWGGVRTVTVIDGGSTYTTRAYGTFTGGTHDVSGDEAQCSLAITNGKIVSIGIIRKGSGYTTAPTLTVTDPGIPGTPAIPGGSGFVGEVQLEFGQVTSITIDDGGTGYTAPPTVKILGDGEGAQALASIEAGSVVSIRMTDYGSGYTKALAVLQGGNKAANALVKIFPWGISGTAIETYSSRVWISNGAAVASFPPKSRVIYTDAKSPTGFGDGGGAFKSDDSFLRVGYHWLRQSNGFLYLGGDSSTNTISGVTTTAATDTAPVVTNFSNQNIDPQIGSPWPESVQVFSRNIVLANPQGVYVSYGGSMTKISTPIDPLYQSCLLLNDPDIHFTSAVAQIFGQPVYMLLLPIIDPILSTAVAKLLMWDGKRWFTSQQSRNLGFIASQSVNSNLTAWGSDGTEIFPLFQTPSTAFTKTVRSKLFASGYWMTKTLVRLQGLFQIYAADDVVAISLDSADAATIPSADYPVNPGGTISPVEIGTLSVIGPIPVAQWGRLVGFTLTTSASDIALLSLLAEAQDYASTV